MFGLCAGRVPFLIEPIEVRIVIGDPLLDRLPRGLDGLHGVDVERRWWRAGKLDDAFPETLEAEEKFDLFRLAEGADRLHGARAAGTLDGADGGGWKRAEGFAVFRFVVCEEVIPAIVDELPEGRGTGTAGLIDGRQRKCSHEQTLCEARSGGTNRILKMSGRAKDWRDQCPLGESGTKILATLKSFALGGKSGGLDGLDGRSRWSNGGVYRPHR